MALTEDEIPKITFQDTDDEQIHFFIKNTDLFVMMNDDKDDVTEVHVVICTKPNILKYETEQGEFQIIIHEDLENKIELIKELKEVCDDHEVPMRVSSMVDVKINTDDDLYITNTRGDLMHIYFWEGEIGIEMNDKTLIDSTQNPVHIIHCKSINKFHLSTSIGTFIVTACHDFQIIFDHLKSMANRANIHFLLPNFLLENEKSPEPKEKKDTAISNVSSNQQTIELDNVQPILSVNLSQVDENNSLEDIQLAVDMDPLNLDARRVLAKKLLHLKDWKSLEEICVDGISFHQDIKEFHYGFAIAIQHVYHNDINEIQIAIEHLEKAKYLGLDTIEVFRALGQHYFKLNHFKKSMHSWQKVLERNPQDQNAKAQIKISKQKQRRSIRL